MVASIGSIRSTRRAETSALRTASTVSTTAQNTTAVVSKRSGSPPMVSWETGAYSRTPTARPAPTMIRTWMSSDATSRLAGAPIARSNVSAAAFWNVMIRKKSPVTHGTTRP